MGKCLGGKILALPLDYPLPKALSRLEFLLDRVLSVQEAVAKFPLSVWCHHGTSWSWKLGRHCLMKSNLSLREMLENLNKIFKTLNIGEFRKQLQVLISFHGHIRNDLDRRSDTSPSEWDSVKIIYNTCGFYVQLLPRIMEHISVNRKSIEKKLAELLKLFHCDRFENHFAVENFRRRRIKTEKYHQRELLQQPHMEFLGSGTDQQNVKAVPF
ncbi:hypothetical protein OROMI_020881 [Orobanche minor]